MSGPDCPKAKKSRKNEDQICTQQQGRGSESTSLNKTNWECLPIVILDDIFAYLNFHDTVQASTTCSNWRQALYHPRKWLNVNFVIDPFDLGRSRYLRQRAGRIVTHAEVWFVSVDPECVKEFLLLLRCFAANYNLKSMTIQPSHAIIEIPDDATLGPDEYPLYKFFTRIYSQHTLSNITFGCSEELSDNLPMLMQMFEDDQKKAMAIESLALATVKADPYTYDIQTLNSKQLLCFRRLQILSVDYDNVSDDLLDALGAVEDFRRLVVHVHGIMDNHPGTCGAAWLRLRQIHPNFRLRMSFIHSIDEVKHMHLKVLCEQMPLSHLKVLFCEQMNINALVLLTVFRHTFTSLMWIDSLNNINSRVFLSPDVIGEDQSQPQQLVLTAWLCTKLSELVVYGYKFYEEDWVGISKLRMDTLRKLEVAESDVIASTFGNQDRNSKLRTYWKPKSDDALDPSIVENYPAEEYILSLVHRDLT